MKEKYMTIDDVTQVRELLTKFQEGYTKRDCKHLDAYMEMFIPSDAMVTVGTNRDEWCFGVKATRDIFDSDWQYWGNLIMDVEGARINTHGDTAWFVADCRMEWPPEEENPSEWRDIIVADYTEDTGRYVGFTTEEKLGMFHEIIALTLESEQKHDPLVSPVRIAGGLTKQSGKWLFHHLHFWVPAPIMPEWHMTSNPSSYKYFNEVTDALVKHQHYFKNSERSEVTSLLEDFQANYLREDTPSEGILHGLFSASDDIYVVDPYEIPAGLDRQGVLETIAMQRQKWDTMELNIKESLIDLEGEIAYIVTNGKFHKHISRETLIEAYWERVLTTLKGKGDVMEQYYDAERLMASAFKELSFGEDRTWEFRLDAIAVREEGKWKFHRIIISCPTMYTLETNYKMTPML